MAARQKIRNLQTLDTEILRLQRKAKNTAEDLEKNFDHFQHHYASMTMGSFFKKSSPGAEKVKEKIFHSVWENEKVQEGLGKIVDHLADKAAEGINHIVDKILHRKEK